MLDIFTYVFGWVSGLFVGMAMGGYFHDYIRYRQVKANYERFFNLINRTGIIVALMNYFGVEITHRFTGTRRTSNENPPRAEPCDVPFNRNSPVRPVYDVLMRAFDGWVNASESSSNRPPSCNAKPNTESKPTQPPCNTKPADTESNPTQPPVDEPRASKTESTPPFGNANPTQFARW